MKTFTVRSAMMESFQPVRLKTFAKILAWIAVGIAITAVCVGKLAAWWLTTVVFGGVMR
jgi:hypothetical protein